MPQTDLKTIFLNCLTKTRLSVTLQSPIVSQRGPKTKNWLKKLIEIFYAAARLVGVVSAHDIDAVPRVRVGWSIQQYAKKTTDIVPDAKPIVATRYRV
jgi:hypothetical protein